MAPVDSDPTLCTMKITASDMPPTVSEPKSCAVGRIDSAATAASGAGGGASGGASASLASTGAATASGASTAASGVTGAISTQRWFTGLQVKPGMHVLPFGPHSSSLFASPELQPDASNTQTSAASRT